MRRDDGDPLLRTRRSCGLLCDDGTASRIYAPRAKGRVNVDGDAELRLVGGCTFHYGPAYVNASWPLATLVVESDGLSVGLRGSWRPLAKCRASVGWADLVAVQLSRRTASWYDREGWFYRFVSLEEGSIDELGDVLDRREVPYKIVRQTWARPFQIS